MIIAQPIQNPKYFGSGLGIAVKHNNTQLLNLINKGLNEIKADGTYDQLIAKYFGK